MTDNNVNIPHRRAEARPAMSARNLDVIVCPCSPGPYLGAQKAGTPIRCEVCGFITREQLDWIERAAVALAFRKAVEWVESQADLFNGSNNAETVRRIAEEIAGEPL